MANTTNGGKASKGKTVASDSHETRTEAAIVSTGLCHGEGAPVTAWPKPPAPAVSPTQETLVALSKPFSPGQLRWRVDENSAYTASDGCRYGRALAYLEARDVMNRLDDVLGGNWSSKLTPLVEDGKLSGFLCELTVRFPDGSVSTRSDVGVITSYESLKGAASDALKRTAVHFDVGRYLYFLDTPWVEVDSRNAIIGELPELPSWALPDNDAALGQSGHGPATVAAFNQVNVRFVD